MKPSSLHISELIDRMLTEPKAFVPMGATNLTMRWGAIPNDGLMTADGKVKIWTCIGPWRVLHNEVETPTTKRDRRCLRRAVAAWYRNASMAMMQQARRSFDQPVAA